MDENVKEMLDKDIHDVEEFANDSFRFAIKTLEANNKREKFIIKILVAIIVVMMGINFYYGYQFANTSVVEATQEGLYNFVDSQGNVISSDLSLEEMKDLIKNNSESNSKKTSQKN